MLTCISNAIEAIIKKLPKKDRDNRPIEEQQWGLYTSDGSRLLGRHPSKEDAEKQERAVQYFKHRTSTNYENMKMENVAPEGWPANRSVPVCENCLKGNHDTFGWDHMKVPPNTDENELGRYSCKNVGFIKGKRVQCACNAAFTELLETLKKKKIKMASNIVNNFLEDSLIFKRADYPNHPNDIVLPKNDWNPRSISEVDIWNYYSGVGKKMIPELKGKNLFIAVVPKGYKYGQKPIYIRHPYHGNSEFIRINNSKEFEEYHGGRETEYHLTLGNTTPFYLIDFDAPGKFSQTTKIVGEIADALEKLPQISKISLHYTGKRGFHIIGNLKKSQDTNAARNFLKGWLKETFGDRGDVVIGESPVGDKGALGLSPMKVNGGHVALWSLRVSGLCCVEVPRAKLATFKRKDASIDKVYKKLTGKAFVFGKDHMASVINGFVNEGAQVVG
jgi:hypothetical protein